MKFQSQYTALCRNLVLIFSLILLANCTGDLLSPEEEARQKGLAFERNLLLGKGVNLANALEAPNEGDWGVTLQADYFSEIKRVGFNSVRVPIRWSAHTAEDSPFKINNNFMDRIDWAIEKAFDNELAVIINIHNYDELMQNPQGEKKKFFSIWKQIAEHYRHYPSELFFELLNEPKQQLSPDVWNSLIEETISLIRKSNPDRTILISGANLGGIYELNKLSLPAGEENIILTFHYYSPFQFTHQGAEWIAGSNDWLGTTWLNRLFEREAVIGNFGYLLEWAAGKNIPINLGEFGSYNKADLNSRVLWTNLVRELAEHNDISWHYWEFCAGFGIYDRTIGEFNENLLNALLPN